MAGNTIPAGAAFYCLECQRQLNDAAQNQCPQCGRTFDPYDYHTVHMPDLDRLLEQVGDMANIIVLDPSLRRWLDAMSRLPGPLREEELKAMHERMRARGENEAMLECVRALRAPGIFDAVERTVREIE